MAKVLALDIGGRRTGMAETDPLGMMAFPLKTVDTGSLMAVLEEYVAAEGTQTMVIGKRLLPRTVLKLSTFGRQKSTSVGR